jgi:glycosyltransferase involved in cell wall biosynthesis
MAVRVSVVIPVYARQKTAERAIRSVLAQDVDGVEIVVVDDASPEPFAVPADLADCGRLRLIRMAANGGAGAARNRGIREARGDWIAYLDSDDYWLPGKLAAQLAAAGSAAAGGAGTAYMTGFRQIALATGRVRDRVPIGSDDPADFAAGCWFAPGATALVARSTIAQVGGFDEALPRLEDLDWFLRLALAGGKVSVVPQVLAVVEVGDRPSTARLEAAIARIEQKWVAPSAAARLGEPARGNLRAYLEIARASICLAQGRRADSALAIARSLALRPRLRAQLKNWWPAGSEA